MNDDRFEAWWPRNPARLDMNPVAKEVARGIWRAAREDMLAEIQAAPFDPSTPAQSRRKHPVNSELAIRIREAIVQTANLLRPPVICDNFPEPTHTALQEHLASLLKAELQILAEASPPSENTPWYPDDSGEWVEVPDACVTCPVPADTVVETLLRNERQNKRWTPCRRIAAEFYWDRKATEFERIVAYRVFKP